MCMELCFHKMLKKCYRFFQFFILKCMQLQYQCEEGKFMFSVSIENALLRFLEIIFVLFLQLLFFSSHWYRGNKFSFSLLSQSCVAVNLNLSTIRRLNSCVKWKRIFFSGRKWQEFIFYLNMLRVFLKKGWKFSRFSIFSVDMKSL